MRTILSTFFVAAHILFSNLSAADTAQNSTLLSEKEPGGSFSVLSVNLNEKYRDKLGRKLKEEQRLLSISRKTPAFDVVLLQKNYAYKAQIRADYERGTSVNGQDDCPRESFFSQANVGLSTLSHFSLQPAFLSFPWPEPKLTAQKPRCRHDIHLPKGGLTGTTIQLSAPTGETFAVDIYNFDLAIDHLGHVDNAITKFFIRLNLALDKIKERDAQTLRPLIIGGHFDFSRMKKRKSKDGYGREVSLENTVEKLRQAQRKAITRLETELGATQAFINTNESLNKYSDQWIFYRSTQQLGFNPVEARALDKEFLDQANKLLTPEAPSFVRLDWFYQQ